ncbi:MAG TPA: hypothetical protein VLC49_08430 [Solirubrobacteraceae bacterium]|nr:hypothetical protein [Solirubrobacteraceae bacterium]
MLGSYLLVKGSHTFVNMDIGSEPQWVPEYGVDLGPARAIGPRADTRGRHLRLVPVRRRMVLAAHGGLVLISSPQR